MRTPLCSPGGQRPWGGCVVVCVLRALRTPGLGNSGPPWLAALPRTCTCVAEGLTVLWACRRRGGGVAWVVAGLYPGLVDRCVGWLFLSLAPQGRAALSAARALHAAAAAPAAAQRHEALASTTPSARPHLAWLRVARSHMAGRAARRLVIMAGPHPGLVRRNAGWTQLRELLFVLLHRRSWLGPGARLAGLACMWGLCARGTHGVTQARTCASRPRRQQVVCAPHAPPAVPCAPPMRCLCTHHAQ